LHRTTAVLGTLGAGSYGTVLPGVVPAGETIRQQLVGARPLAVSRSGGGEDVTGLLAEIAGNTGALLGALHTVARVIPGRDAAAAQAVRRGAYQAYYGVS